MKTKKEIAQKAVPAAVAASLLATLAGCATQDQGSYGVSSAQPSQQMPESAPANNSQEDTDCFLTTACIRGLGLPDDCHELTVLRHFRDHHLMRSSAGRAAVLHYYRMAPRVVLAIRQAVSPDAECREIYDRLVNPAVELIEAGRFDDAFVHYRKTVFALAEKFGVDQA